MFSRQRPAHPLAFEDRLRSLAQAGFTVEPAGKTTYRVARRECAAVIHNPPAIAHAGILVGGEIATLVDGGFQKFLTTTSGRREPALAAQLQSLHDFEEELRETLGLESLYNLSLGTTFDRHTYDRLTGRE